VVPPGERPRRQGSLGRRWEAKARKHPGLEPDRWFGGRQQFEQLLAGRHQLPHVLAARVACVQVRDRYGALAPGEHAKR
jgi:hypothetical protein